MSVSIEDLRRRFEKEGFRRTAQVLELALNIAEDEGVPKVFYDDNEVKEKPFEGKLFSEETKKRLIAAGYEIYYLHGYSLKEMKEGGIIFNTQWSNSFDMIQDDTSLPTEVAIPSDCDSIFLANSFGRSHKGRKEVLSDFKEKFTRTIEGTNVRLGYVNETVELNEFYRKQHQGENLLLEENSVTAEGVNELKNGFYIVKRTFLGINIYIDTRLQGRSSDVGIIPFIVPS